MSRDLVKSVIASTEFKKVEAIAANISIPRNRVHDDVLFGLSTSDIENVTYVRIPRKSVWLDRTPNVLKSGHLLLAHKPRLPCMNATLTLARDEDDLVESYACIPTSPCTDCAHTAKQTTCTLEIRETSKDAVRC